MIVFSFTMDYQHVMNGSMPHPFRWDVFAIGMVIGTGSYVAAACAPAPSSATLGPLERTAALEES